MNDEVNSVVDNFVNAIQDENLAQAQKHFDNLIGDKINDALDQERVNVASNMFVVSNDDLETEEDFELDDDFEAEIDAAIDAELEADEAENGY